LSDYNEVKLEILEALEELGEATVEDVASMLGRSYESVGMALLRYHRHRLVSRYRARGRIRMYSLTERGMERLEYLRSEFDEDEGRDF
jgi:DNA-binding MarR family transcriptional regulator